MNKLDVLNAVVAANISASEASLREDFPGIDGPLRPRSSGKYHCPYSRETKRDISKQERRKKRKAQKKARKNKK